MAENRASELRKLEAVVKDHTEQMVEIRAHHAALKLQNDQILEELKELKSLLRGDSVQPTEERNRDLSMVETLETDPQQEMGSDSNLFKAFHKQFNNLRANDKQERESVAISLFVGGLRPAIQRLASEEADSSISDVEGQKESPTLVKEEPEINLKVNEFVASMQVKDPSSCSASCPQIFCSSFMKKAGSSAICGLTGARFCALGNIILFEHFEEVKWNSTLGFSKLEVARVEILTENRNKQGGQVEFQSILMLLSDFDQKEERDALSVMEQRSKDILTPGIIEHSSTLSFLYDIRHRFPD